MPPIMGAAAFVVAEYVGIPYIIVCLHAAIPAILYYAALFFMVDFEARRRGLRGLPKEKIPDAKKSILNYGHMFISLIILLYVMIIGYTATMAGVMAVISAYLISFLRKATRLGVRRLLKALEAAAKMAASVAAACAGAGLIIGVLDITGLGLKFSSIITKIAGGNLIVLLILLMVTAIILGMGMPTTAAYITVAVIMVPALLELGVSPLVAHMFAFYYACLSLYTPPVATASYVAAGIAGADAMKTGITSMMLGSSLLIVPFMFVFAPSLLFVGAPLEILLTLFTSIVGVAALGGALIGFMVKRCNIVERVLLFIAAISLIFPGATALIGFVLLGAVLVMQSPLTFRRLVRYIRFTRR